MSRSAFPGVVIVAACLGACALSTSPRTAVEYERDAARREARRDFDAAPGAVQEATRPVPSATQVITNPEPQIPLGNENGMWIGGYGAGDAMHQERIARREMEEASRLRDYAAVTCTRVPTEAQIACPIPTNASVQPLPRGVRYVGRGASAETLGATVRCALARAEVARPEDADRCPLLVPDADVRVVPREDGAAVEIVGCDRAQADEIRRRAGLAAP